MLEGIDLVLPRGGLTALVGPNGAGKSTLLSLAARLLPLQQGSVTIDGLPVGSTPGKVLAKKLAILRQESGPPPRVSVHEMVGFGRFPHSGGRMTAEDKAMVEEALARFELGDLANRSLDRLSGGQQQRVAIARALLLEPLLILADEPTGNLDEHTGEQVLELLVDLTRQHGRTLIMATHNGAIADRADRVLRVQEGHLFESSAPAAAVAA
ncbi:ATP-binding cassette domain-containing protein [Synechococcus sp. BA-120 BA3]|nr:ATP-binding cassette domain-containing protein [Synechococcus sp. BA-120 BA3]